MPTESFALKAERTTPQELPVSVRQAFASHRTIVGIVAAQAAMTLALAILYPGTNAIGPRHVASTTLGLLILVLPLCIVALCLRRVARARPEGSATVALIGEIGTYLSDRDRLRNGLPVLVLFIPFMTLFAHLKANIPAIQPFAWDETFTLWDRTLFLGHLPYEVLAPVMSHPLVLSVTDILYVGWFYLMWGVLLACAFQKQGSELRTRYIVAFFLVWLLQGNVLALLLSSAGPCFYAPLGLSPDPYQPLMATLRAADAEWPIFALTMQDMLWSGHVGASEPMGISAMPSLHNAVAVLMVLGAWRIGRALGLAFAAYALWIFAGSISLGWHYAVDGFVALPATVAIWIASGWLARRQHRSDLHPAATGGLAAQAR
ncbi:phosphatase PAP2 family protein [Aurantimonas sp. Leaf443]|uniref:phosphatase PAP2 family protein n=1 Tax=Aurantimonas sp. Leaf443 TaxID=1736378 RepID=UPI0006F6CB6F|nr:phosphatase PAP2 family protein [Aurantimonas sp. Leaf443]KQT85258.1 hypothetical protein ASG48_08340 [Aurantimonas sp. Leaf443]